MTPANKERSAVDTRSAEDVFAPLLAHLRGQTPAEPSYPALCAEALKSIAFNRVVGGEPYDVTSVHGVHATIRKATPRMILNRSVLQLTAELGDFDVPARRVTELLLYIERWLDSSWHLFPKTDIWQDVDLAVLRQAKEKHTTIE